MDKRSARIASLSLSSLEFVTPDNRMQAFGNDNRLGLTPAHRDGVALFGLEL